MATEYSSGVKFREGDRIKGYEILRVFDPGGFAFSAKAKAPNGRPVFFKKYKRPGGSSEWLAGFIAYQTELKRRIQGDAVARNLCYEFIEFFEMCKSGGAVPLRAFYQVFEWVEGGKDLSRFVEEIRTRPGALDWNQRVIFARVMLAGVNAIHKVGIIHTDIKPENFYLLPEPTIAAKYKLRVIDMDFSLLEGRPAPWHGYEGYVGTPGYLSPEHLTGQVPVKASDVFTLGLILGQLLGGGHPAAPALDSYDDQVRNGRLKTVAIEKPIEGVPDLDFLAQVINSCFRLEPDKRPTTEQLLMALNGRLTEWDGTRPKVSVGGPLPPVKPARAAPEPAPKRAVTIPPPSAPPVAPVRPAPPLGTAPSPAPSPAGVSKGVELVGPGGQKLKANIATKFGRSVLRGWGADYEKFMSADQFHLFKDPSGCWMIEHCATATNATNVNGSVLSTPVPVQSGMTITLGKTGKCPITLNLG